MEKLKTTNTLLLIIVVPLVFFLLQTLSFIFIPLFLAMFISILFLPLMRKMTNFRFPKLVSIMVIILIIAAVIALMAFLFKLSSNEILAAESQFFQLAELKLVALVENIESTFGLRRAKGVSVFTHYFQNNTLMDNFGNSIDFVTTTITTILMTAFFVVLFLLESISIESLMGHSLFRNRFSFVKTFIQIENDIIKFLVVKFIASLLTGIGFSLACLSFGISFPIFWGLFAFLINFVQMVGSIVSVILLSLFAFVEIDPTGRLLFFILAITAVQVVIGGILEPVSMGKTFSVNVVTVLVMLMLWGFIWGIPGLIMSIPITVILKIIFEKFEGTLFIANLMSGSPPKLADIWNKRLESD